MRKSGSDLGWALGFEVGLFFYMMMGAHLEYPLGYSINMFLVLELDKSVGTWEGYLVVVSLGTLDVLMIGTV